MAKKKTNTKKAQQSSHLIESIKHYTMSERVHFVIGLLISFFTIYVGIAMISYFFTGDADQSIVHNLKVGDLLSSHDKVSNWAGIRGAYMSDLIMDKWFGISSFFLLFFFGSLGVWLMKLCSMHLFKRFLLCSILTIWSSLLLAYIFGRGDTIFFYLGGRHGILLSEWLQNNIGFVGVILILLAGLILIAVFLSNRAVPVIRDKMSIGNIRKKGSPKVPNDDPYATSGEDDTDEEGEDEEVEESEDDSDVDDEKEDPSDNENSEKDDFTVEVGKGDGEPYDSSELGQYDPRLDLSSFRLPDIGLLKKYNQDSNVDMDEQNENQRRIKKTLEDFGIVIVSIKATVGPTITLYEVVPERGIKISKIRSLEDDIALRLSAFKVRIVAPIPGKGTIGIEIPNKNPQIVSMESVISSRKFIDSKFELPIALGRTITNDVFMFDLTKTPHLLVAGATGQGKSVGLNAIITSLLYKKHPSELKFVLIDPKKVEFSIYENLERHYLAKLPELDKAVVTDKDSVIHTLKSLCKEMEDRYKLLESAHVRKLSEYNEKFIDRKLNPEKGHKFLPYIVVIIDEFGDLIMTAGKEIEMPIARIAQLARAVGIHMIIATQRPSTNIITGTIKANFPVRIAFRVMSMMDSRVVLDASGANQLVGKGDLLYSGGNDMTRVQCAFVDTKEIEDIVNFIGSQPGFETAYKLPEVFDEPSSFGGSSSNSEAIDMSKRDSLFEDVARMLVLKQQASVSLIQRQYSIGFARAGRLMDQLEAAGIVSGADGIKQRQLLISDEYSLDNKLAALRN